MKQIINKLEYCHAPESRRNLHTHADRLSIANLVNNGFIIDESDPDITKIINRYDRYKITTVRLGDLLTRCHLSENQQVGIENNPRYLFINGDVKSYKDNVKIANEKYKSKYNHSPENFRKLITKLNKHGYDSRHPLFVDKNYIVSGQHRAAWLYSKYGPDYEIQVVQVIRTLSRKYSLKRLIRSVKRLW